MLVTFQNKKTGIIKSVNCITLTKQTIKENGTRKEYWCMGDQYFKIDATISTNNYRLISVIER